jgi:hypothetical protein
MSAHASWLEIRGEVYVTLEAAADCYRVEARWLERLHEEGLLARAERVEGALALPASELDRLAAILRWHRHLGVELEVVRALLVRD